MTILNSILSDAYPICLEMSRQKKHVSFVLNEHNKHMLYIPEGFAHGFLTLENDTIFSYKCGNFYNKESEGGIMWNDKDLGINWNFSSPLLSDKDNLNVSFGEFNSPFEYNILSVLNEKH